jgi:hypothetical protein
MATNTNNTQEVVIIVTEVQQPLILVSQDVSVIRVEGVCGGGSTSGVTCVTTPKMPIVDFVCVLPSKPLGNFVLGIAQVYLPYGDAGHFVTETHDNIALDWVNGDYVLRFLDTSYDYTGGLAVVTYIEAT